MTTTLSARAGAPSAGAGMSQRPRLEPPAGRRPRLSELTLAAAVMVGFALAAVAWHLATTERHPALALARAVPRGEAIGAADLRVVYLATDAPLARLSPNQRPAVVGRPAVADLPAGTLLSPASVAPAPAVAPGEGVVGLSLEPGQVPASALAVGDVVNVVAGPEEPGAGAGPEAVLARRAVVHEVGEVAGQGRRLVALRLAEAEANRVAAAAGRGPLRLVLVGGGS